jgi:SAM-dependent methyltransferase
MGLAALISGSEKYLAFDVVKHADVERNLKVFDELVPLFRNRSAIPGNDELPHVKPQLENYDFPGDIFDANRLEHALDESRLASIRNSIIDFRRADSRIQYKVPWYEAGCLQKESVDMIFSQAVLEHVDDLQNTYRAMHLWLQPLGYLSHQVDFRCHGTAQAWNGHWAYSDLMWKLIRGRRPYLLNRAPLSTHKMTLEGAGFAVVCEKKVRSESRLAINQLAPRFRSMSDDDLVTSGAFIQAAKAN